MKTSRLMILSLIVLMIPFSSAYASCATFVPVIDNIRAYNEVSAVFFGTVIKAHEQIRPSERDVESYFEYTTFSVHYIFKGSLVENKVRTNPNLSIGYDGFEEGQTYFVYAYDPANEVYSCVAPMPFPTSLLLLIFHFPFALFPIGIITGVVIVWRIRK